jgi:restriction system protein
MGVRFAASTTTLPNGSRLLHQAASEVAKGLWYDLVHTWPLWAVVGCVALTSLGLRLRRLRLLSLSGIVEIDRMDGRTFEQYLGGLFGRLGYRTEVTRYVGDYGADLVVTKDGKRYAVQAKRSNKAVGLKAVQEVVAACQVYRCQGALVVTNRGFTAQARQLARANGVELWDRQALVAKSLLVRRLVDPSGIGSLGTTEALGNDLEPERTRPHSDDDPLDAPTDLLPTEPAVAGEARCTTCGVVVSARVREYCVARPGRFGGLIYCFKHQRSAHH